MIFITITHAMLGELKKKNATMGQIGTTYIDAHQLTQINHKEGIGQGVVLVAAVILILIIGKILVMPAQVTKNAPEVLVLIVATLAATTKVADN